MSDNKIHELDVYPEQVACAKKITDVFHKNNAPVLLIAQMQQGKTGTVICVIDDFIRACNKANKSFEVIYLINLSDNDIKSQTEARFIESGLLENIKILHHNNIKSVKPAQVDIRLIVVDECHIALGKDRPFHNFMDRCGINYGHSIDTWENKNNYVLSVSATPYAHVIRSKIDDKAFHPIVLEMSQEYFSMQHMQDAKRIRPSQQLVDSENNVTDFLVERIDEFVNECEIHGVGYLIMRTRGNKILSISDYIKQTYATISVKVFSCREKNIVMTDLMLKCRPKRPTVILISGSMRAGKTLTTTKHIRMWVDSHNSKSDTMCQSVGRCLGYSNENHTKFDDIFPIYCCTDEINECIEFFNRHNCSPNVPSGNWNKKFSTSEDGGHYFELPCKNEQEVKDIYQGLAIISVCSKNSQNSVAQIVMKNLNRGNLKNGIRVFHLDKPHPNYNEDFDNLSKEKPNLIGKFVVYKASEKVSKSKNYSPENSLHKDVIFS